MRIVAGSARGRTLQGPKGQDIRPTADRVRQALFNVLGQFFEGGQALDLFAGTGALGLEALSRGVSRAVFVDSGREAQGLVRENAKSTGFEAQIELMPMDALKAAAQLAGARRKFELVFADPPYAQLAIEKLVSAIEQGALLAEDGWLCVEHDKREVAPEQVGRLTRVDQRRFGDTLVSLYRYAGERAASS
jgi:16S rRNA (guanine966-N2)-methyltransferase